MRFLGEPDDLDRVGQRAGERLVDEDRLVRPEDRPDLLQVRPAVDALQEHDVDPRQQVVDRTDDRRPGTCRAVAAVKPATRSRLEATSGLPPGYAATTRTPARSPCAFAPFRTLVNATTCEVSSPMIPTRMRLGAFLRGKDARAGRGGEGKRQGQSNNGRGKSGWRHVSTLIKGRERR